MFARVEIGVIKFPTKTAEKQNEETKKIGSEIFVQKSKWACGRAHPVFSAENFHV